MDLKFRRLRSDEIECRVGTSNDNGLSLLLYKDARCDMNLLDETVGPMNWMRSHSRENANCVVSIYDGERGIWISKEDTGTESNTEAAKGLASDSFKRACVNWGIGRELYTAPFIWVKSGHYEATTGKNGKPIPKDKFAVKSIGYTETGEIRELEIINVRSRDTVYQYGTKPATEPEKNTPAKNQSKEPKTEKPATEKNQEQETGPEAPLCSSCGHPIKPVKNGDEILTVADVVNRSTKVYKKPVCLECAMKLNGNKGR